MVTTPLQIGLGRHACRTMEGRAQSGLTAAAAVRDIELTLEQPCTPNARETTPLFGDAHNRPFTYSHSSQLHAELKSRCVRFLLHFTAVLRTDYNCTVRPYTLLTAVVQYE